MQLVWNCCNENLKEFCNERKSHNLLYNKYGQCNTTGTVGIKKKTTTKILVNIKGNPKIDNILYFVWNKYGRSININDKNKKHVSVWIFKHMESPKWTICYMEHNKNTTSDLNIYIKVIYIHVYHIIIIMFRMVSYKISF